MLQDDLLDDVDFVVNQYSDRRKELQFRVSFVWEGYMLPMGPLLFELE